MIGNDDDDDGDRQRKSSKPLWSRIAAQSAKLCNKAFQRSQEHLEKRPTIWLFSVVKSLGFLLGQRCGLPNMH